MKRFSVSDFASQNRSQGYSAQSAQLRQPSNAVIALTESRLRMHVKKSRYRTTAAVTINQRKALMQNDTARQPLRLQKSITPKFSQV
jgi:hypothetical protein